MSLLYRILEEHEALLKSRGFDEESLNSPNKQGWLLKELKQNLGIAIRDMLWDDSPCTFTLKAVGFFNDYRDMVLYDLNYKFDAHKGDLQIVSLDVDYEQQRIKFDLGKNTDLPDAYGVLKMIKEGNIKRRGMGNQRIVKDVTRQRKL